MVGVLFHRRVVPESLSLEKCDEYLILKYRYGKANRKVIIEL